MVGSILSPTAPTKKSRGTQPLCWSGIAAGNLVRKTIAFTQHVRSSFASAKTKRLHVGSAPIGWRDHVIMWVKDASRAIDYAETRPELDHAKLAFYGFSWGATMGPFVTAVEPRIKVGIFALGGLDFQKSLAEANAINFLQRVKQPVLMLNGRYDFFCPLESCQEPFFHWLSSGKGQNKLLLYDSGHFIPI